MRPPKLNSSCPTVFGSGWGQHPNPVDRSKADASEIDIASGVARFYNRNSNGMLKVTTPFGYVLAEPGSTVDIYVGDQSVEVLALNGRVDYFQQGATPGMR